MARTASNVRQNNTPEISPKNTKIWHYSVEWVRMYHNTSVWSEVFIPHRLRQFVVGGLRLITNNNKFTRSVYLGLASATRLTHNMVRNSQHYGFTISQQLLDTMFVATNYRIVSGVNVGRSECLLKPWKRTLAKSLWLRKSEALQGNEYKTQKLKE